MANLHSLEKIYEEFLKRKITKYIEDNKILHKNHHGGIKLHSTMTAKALVDYKLNKGYEEDKVSVLLSTDMSTAFNTIDHLTLIKKLKYYGFDKDSVELMVSYLSDRYQYVETKKLC